MRDSDRLDEQSSSQPRAKKCGEQVQLTNGSTVPVSRMHIRQATGIHGRGVSEALDKIEWKEGWQVGGLEGNRAHRGWNAIHILAESRSGQRAMFSCMLCDANRVALHPFEARLSVIVRWNSMSTVHNYIVRHSSIPRPHNPHAMRTKYTCGWCLKSQLLGSTRLLAAVTIPNLSRSIRGAIL